jgi:hypothetical protein
LFGVNGKEETRFRILSAQLHNLDTSTPFKRRTPNAWGFQRGVERGVERWREIVAPFSRKSRIAKRTSGELREALQSER